MGHLQNAPRGAPKVRRYTDEEANAMASMRSGRKKKTYAEIASIFGTSIKTVFNQIDLYSDTGCGTKYRPKKKAVPIPPMDFSADNLQAAD